MTPHALIAPARLAGAPLLRTQSDSRLVDLVRAGNGAAFEAIVSRYRRPLLRYCSGFMPEARAEDAVQTALVRAHDALHASSGEMQLRPWLYRIAHNCALNSLRDRGLQHEELSEHVDGVERPDQAYEKSERLRDVLGAVSALPERQRDAIVLRELEGRSYEEIATELGVSDGSVRQLLNRGRNTLRAGMTSVTPVALLARAPWVGSGETVTARVAEMCGAGAGAAALTKVCATVVVTGAVVGGVASSLSGGPNDNPARAQQPESPARVANTAGPAVRDHRTAQAHDGVTGLGLTRSSPGSGKGEDSRGADDNSAHGGGDRDGDRGEHGSREDDGEHGGGDSDDRSGPDRGGTGESEPRETGDEPDRRGPGHSGGGEPVEVETDDDPPELDSSNSGSGGSGSGSGKNPDPVETHGESELD